MSEKERYYHLANFILVPLAVISLIIFDASAGTVLNEGQFIQVTYIIVAVISVGWLLISGLINENSRNLVIHSVKSIVKFVVSIVGAMGVAGCLLGPFEVILIGLILMGITLIVAVLWQVGALALSIYLLVTSYKAIKADESAFV